MKISHLNQTNQRILSIWRYCYFSLDQWEIRIHLLWEKCFNIPLHCDSHLNQTKFNGLLPLTIAGVLKKLPPIQDSRMVCTIQGPGDDDNNYDDDTNDDDDGRPVCWHPVHHGRWPTQFSQFNCPRCWMETSVAKYPGMSDSGLSKCRQMLGRLQNI